MTKLFDKNGNVQLHDLDNGKGLVIRGLGSVFGAAKTGDFVEATGQYNLYYGTHQLQNLTEVKVIESGKTITPAEITTFDEIKALTAEDQGRLFNVKVPNLKILEVKERSIMVGLDDENKVEVYSIDTLVEDLVVGQKVELANALGSQYNGNFQFDAQVADVIVATPLTDAEKVQVVKDQLIANYEGQTVNMDSNDLLPLPTALHGATITWNTPEGAIVDGKWKTVEANEEVTLTATIKLGSEPDATQAVNVTIKYIAPIVGNQTIYKFDHLTAKGTELTAENAKEKLSGTVEGTDILNSVTSISKVYEGNGTGGAYPETSKLLKISSGSANGNMTLKFNEGTKISKVIIQIQKWSASEASSLEITGAGAAQDISAEANKTLTFEFSTPTDTLEFKFVKRSFIFSITIVYE